MKIAIVFCVMMYTMSTMSSKYLYNVTDEEWNLFKMTYNKLYSDDNEELFRKKIYLENKLKIERHNKLYENGEVSYTMGMNQFGDITSQEFLGRMNLVAPNLRDIDTNYTFANLKNDQKFPKNLNWAHKGCVTSVGNQKNCSSSWAFSVIGAIESQKCRRTGNLVPLSAQNLLDCTYMNCKDGGNRLDAFDYIQNMGGIDTLESYPYKAKSNEKCTFKRENIGAKITKVISVPKGDANLMAALAKYGPISVSIKVSVNFQLYSSGVFEVSNCGLASHDVLVIGYSETEYGQKYWIIKNSWGSNWGEKGYIYLSRDINNLCSVSDYGLVPEVSYYDWDGDDDLLKYSKKQSF